MELQGVGRLASGTVARLRRRGARGLALCLLLAATGLIFGGLAPAVGGLAPAVGGLAPAVAAADIAQGAPAGTPTLVSSKTVPPSGGFHLTADKVLALASRNAAVRAELRTHPHLVAYEYTRLYPTWQVSWFTPVLCSPCPTAHCKASKCQKEMIQVYVDDQIAQVTQVWTGYQIAWTMARGYPGAFGRKVNSLIVWLPLCVLFIAPFLPWRRRPTLLHLDLLMMLGFSVSLAWFNHANLGLSVPAIYPFMLYLLVRMLMIGFGRGRPRAPLRPLVPTTWLAIALVFLIGFRIGLNVTDSNVIDVGFAGVVGANKILYGQKLYGGWPSDNPQGDTYGPINYDAYVPFNLAFGWSGVWDDLPAAHAASIAFDLLTMLALFLLGRAIRGPTLGVMLAYLWAAYPFTLFTLSSNSNDALVALLLVVTLLVSRWSPARGIAAAFAGLTKFAPLALAPLFLRGTGPPPSRGQIVRYVGGFALAVAAAMAPVVISGDLGAFWRDTIVYQVGRPAPFSIWGLWGGSFTNTSNSLSVEQHLVEGAMLAMAVGVMFVPARRGTVEVAALGAAVLIAFQLCLTYWFYLYIVWFFPFAIIAVTGAHLPPAAAEDRSPPGESHLSTWDAPDASLPAAI